MKTNSRMAISFIVSRMSLQLCSQVDKLYVVSFVIQYQLLHLEVFQHELYSAFNICMDISITDHLRENDFSIQYCRKKQLIYQVVTGWHPLQKSMLVNMSQIFFGFLGSCSFGRPKGCRGFFECFLWVVWFFFLLTEITLSTLLFLLACLICW